MHVYIRNRGAINVMAYMHTLLAQVESSDFLLRRAGPEEAEEAEPASCTHDPGIIEEGFIKGGNDDDALQGEKQKSKQAQANGRHRLVGKPADPGGSEETFLSSVSRLQLE